MGGQIGILEEAAALPAGRACPPRGRAGRQRGEEKEEDKNHREEALCSSECYRDGE